MMTEDLNFLSEYLKIPPDKLKNIEIPEGSMVITSIIDYSSPITENPEVEQLADDTVDQYLYEFHSVEYICQDCDESFDTPDLHRQHELSTHMNITVEDVFDFQTFDTNEEISEELYGKYALRSRSRTTKCLLCNEEFPDKDTLRSHEEIHQKRTQYFCSTCQFTSSDSEELKEHEDNHQYDSGLSDGTDQIIEDSNDPEWSVDQKTIKKFNIGVKTRKKIKYFHCKLCNYKTITRARLENHKHRHQNSELFICEDCGERFKLKKSLTRHLNLFHNSEKTQCFICEEKFADQDALQVHMENHKKGKFYCCDLCNFKNLKLMAVKKHRSFHLKSQSYICNDCGKIMKFKKSVENHLIFFHNSDNQCQICLKKTANQKDLQIHLEVHKKGKLYYCYLCNYQTVSLSLLKKHKNRHLESNLFTCNHCGKQVESKKSMKNHLILYHNLDNQCQICLKKTANQKALRRHYKVHRKGNFFNCNLCNYKAGNLLSVKIHKDQHMRPKFYFCRHCDKSYRFNTAFKKHLKTCRS